MTGSLPEDGDSSKGVTCACFSRLGIHRLSPTGAELDRDAGTPGRSSTAVASYTAGEKVDTFMLAATRRFGSRSS